MAKRTRHWTEYQPVCSAPLRTGPNRGQPATGTKAGYNRHWKVGEPACLDCLGGARADYEPVDYDERVCPECGADFKPQRVDQRHCRRTCFYKARRRKKSHKERERLRYQRRLNRTTGWRSCECCGCLFPVDATRNRVRRKLCSKDCRPAPNTECAVGFVDEIFVPWASCAGCRQPFVASNRRRLCPACPRPSGYTPRQPRVLECEMCGGEMLARQGLKRYCSVECLRRSPAYQAGRARSKARRRARKRNAERVEAVDRLVVFERDGWACQICGEKVDRNAQVPDERAATVDHILPLARGGDHTYANVQTAHFLCNSLKGDRVPEGGEQLRLVG